MEPQAQVFFAAQRELTERETVAVPSPDDDAFTMQARPSTIETWLGDRHAAGD
ncbi:MAG: hypothetical protein ABR591_09865 [Candidatus Velthaea sp.]